MTDSNALRLGLTLFKRLVAHFKSHKVQTELLSTQEAVYYATIDREVVKCMEKGKFDQAYSRLEKILREDVKVTPGPERISLERSPSTMSTENELDLGDLCRVQSAWKRDFVGPMEKILRRVVEESELNFSVDKDYAKILSCIQSSGSGKSRTISEHGLFRVGVIYTFRVGDESGFPPGDVEITQLVTESASGREDSRSLEHATAIGLLSASVENGVPHVLCQKPYTNNRLRDSFQIIQ